MAILAAGPSELNFEVIKEPPAQVRRMLFYSSFYKIEKNSNLVSAVLIVDYGNYVTNLQLHHFEYVSQIGYKLFRKDFKTYFS